MKKGAVIYIRVSSAEQVDNFSLTTQEAECRRYCASSDWTTLEVFREEGQSASSIQRSEFQRMMKYCEEHKTEICHVVVHAVSRFSRNTLDFHAMRALLSRWGIGVRSATETLNEDPDGTLVGSLMVVLAEYDNNQKAKRTKLGMKAGIAAGNWTHRAPLGYANSPRTATNAPRMVHDRVRARLIRTGFELIATGTVTQHEVLHQLTAAGLTSRTGAILSPQSFHKILRNPLYAGRIRVQRLGENLKGNFEPIVSPTLFDEVQDILNGRRPSLKVRQRNHPDFPLRVFLKCGVCGVPLTGSRSTGRRGKKYAYYNCRSTSCKGVRAKAELLENGFLNFLARLTPKPELMRLFREMTLEVWRRKEAVNFAHQGAIKQRLETLDRNIDSLNETFVYSKSIDQATYDRMLDNLRRQKLLAEMEDREAEAASNDIEAVINFAEHLIANAGEMWRCADLDQRQKLQQVLFPDGISYADGEFRTVTTCAFFNVLTQITDSKEPMASPRGFEPRFSP